MIVIFLCNRDKEKGKKSQCIYNLISSRTSDNAAVHGTYMQKLRKGLAQTNNSTMWPYERAQ